MDELGFPEGFRWGVSISGFQYEMGGPEGLDPNTDWYVWVHDPLNIAYGLVSGDLPERGPGYWTWYAADHGLAEWLDLNAYRLNVEWSRVFPRATFDVEVDVEREDGLIVDVEIGEEQLEELHRMADREALEHYRRIILDLQSRGITVTLNLSHFTLPLWLHNPIEARASALRGEAAGWIDERCVVEFTKFAAYIAWRLGDLIDEWSTMNEPLVVSVNGYLRARSGFPPGFPSFKAFREASIHLVEAHARAYDAIKRWDSNGEVGIIYVLRPIDPLNPEDDGHLRAAERADYLYNRWFLDAITEGRLDKTLKNPEAAERVRCLEHRLDWLGVNYYTRQVVSPNPTDPDWFRVEPGYGFSATPRGVSKAGLPTTDFGWEIYPQGLRRVLRDAARYGVPLYVTENGLADAEDRMRSQFILRHLLELHRALERDGIDVRGYYHWSLIDNYEWASGYKPRFGLIKVDYETKRRTPRPSAYIYREIAGGNAITERLIGLIEGL